MDNGQPRFSPGMDSTRFFNCNTSLNSIRERSDDNFDDMLNQFRNVSMFEEGRSISQFPDRPERDAFFTPSRPSPAFRSPPFASFQPASRSPGYRSPRTSPGTPRPEVVAAASGISAVWSGTLPPRNASRSAFSCKVFLGGVPWDITENDLVTAFGMFGHIRVEWPGIHDKQRTRLPKGHLYIIFEHESAVRELLGSCSYDRHHQQHNWFYKVASKRMLVKSVQVIPWQIADAAYTNQGLLGLHLQQPLYKIFVANLHGMITAEGLARIFNDLFGSVIAATLDTDKARYPIGSGRITFSNPVSHMKAIRAGTVEVRTAKFSRQIKIDPYLEESECSVCKMAVGPYFCRNLTCFNYFCKQCWTWQHGEDQAHVPMVRPSRNGHEEPEELVERK
ncbi:hypothetical protein RvY_04103 [Ramazzottius varieornatus]|uniref:RRM domain-containing protein n=1 Tax=Ramazzottius varieornatus TaxID=947166 RepID=A0A1D1UXE8_RAMVA|nr:hypothetical protein RvY_04103 [Ramazzottius varieornatus]